MPQRGMKRRSGDAPFRPDPAQMALAPEVTGNEINGLGEPAFRRAVKVYWAEDPDTIPHGQMQRWFYTVDPGLPDFARLRAERQAVLDAPLTAVAGEAMPLDFAAGMDAFKTNGVIDKYGASAFNIDWAFQGVEIGYRNVIVLGFAHDYGRISQAPNPVAGAEVMAQYLRAAAGAVEVANWLRELGYDAEPLTGPMAGKIAMIPAAIAAGMGELGKHGSLICPEFGSSFRLSAVLTDAPVPLNEPVDHGIDGFCANCRVCSDACPPDAIFADKQLVRGVQKYYVDFDSCLPFFNQHQGCGICIAVCPWSRPGVGLNLAAKLARRAERLSEVSDQAGA